MFIPYADIKPIVQDDNPLSIKTDVVLKNLVAFALGEVTDTPYVAWYGEIFRYEETPEGLELVEQVKHNYKCGICKSGGENNIDLMIKHTTDNVFIFDEKIFTQYDIENPLRTMKIVLDELKEEVRQGIFGFNKDTRQMTRTGVMSLQALYSVLDADTEKYERYDFREVENAPKLKDLVVIELNGEKYLARINHQYSLESTITIYYPQTLHDFCRVYDGILEGSFVNSDGVLQLRDELNGDPEEFEDIALDYIDTLEFSPDLPERASQVTEILGYSEIFSPDSYTDISPCIDLKNPKTRPIKLQNKSDLPPEYSVIFGFANLDLALRKCANINAVVGLHRYYGEATTNMIGIITNYYRRKPFVSMDTIYYLTLEEARDQNFITNEEYEYYNKQLRSIVE